MLFVCKNVQNDHCHKHKMAIQHHLFWGFNRLQHRAVLLAIAWVSCFLSYSLVWVFAGFFNGFYPKKRASEAH